MNPAHPPPTHPLRAVLAAISLALLLALPSPLQAQAPDLTQTDLTTINRAWTWSLGATSQVDDQCNAAGLGHGGIRGG